MVLVQVKAWHDGSGFGADWLLDSVTVILPSVGAEWHAPYNEWIKGGQENARAKPVTMTRGSPVDVEAASKAAAAGAEAKEAARLAAAGPPAADPGQQQQVSSSTEPPAASPASAVNGKDAVAQVMSWAAA